MDGTLLTLPNHNKRLGCHWNVKNDARCFKLPMTLIQKLIDCRTRDNARFGRSWQSRYNLSAFDEFLIWLSDLGKLIKHRFKFITKAAHFFRSDAMCSTEEEETSTQHVDVLAETSRQLQDITRGHLAQIAQNINAFL